MEGIWVLTAGPGVSFKMFVRWLINTIAIMCAVKFVPGIVYTGEWWGILFVGALFGLVNTFIRPLVKFFTLPLLILSLGLFTFIINAFMLNMTSWLSEKFGLGFHVQGFKPALVGALIISLVSLVLSCLMPSEERTSG